MKCNCKDEIKTGQTSVMCCNVCGLPDEEFWQKGDEKWDNQYPDFTNVSREEILDEYEKVWHELEKDEILKKQWCQKAMESAIRCRHLEAKVNFYRETTDKVRELVFNSKEIGEPCQPLYDAIVDKLNEYKEEIERLKGIIVKKDEAIKMYQSVKHNH